MSSNTAHAHARRVLIGPPSWRRDFLYIRQLPCLFEQRLLWSVEAEEHLKFAVGASRHPVGVTAWRRLRAEVDVDRPVRVLAQPRRLRRTAWRWKVADQAMGRAIVNRGGPILRHG